MKIFFAILSFLFLFAAVTCSLYGGEIKASSDQAVAEVHGKKITTKDIEKFARNSLNFATYLTIPGGQKHILNDMIFRELLYLEGHDLNIPELPGEGKEAYVRKVFKTLMVQKPTWDHDKLKDFYEKHPYLFSSPLFVRISTIRVYVQGHGDEEALKKIKDAKRMLESGKSFEEVALTFSEDKFSRDRRGDLGFLPISDIKPEKLKKLFLQMKLGEVSDIYKIDGYYALFKLTAKREPVLEPFDEEFVKKTANTFLAKQAVEAIRERLSKKWGVRYLDPAYKPD